MNSKLTGEGDEGEVPKKPLQFSAINIELFIEIDMKTKVVQHVLKIIFKVFRFSKLSSFQSFQ